MKISRIPYLAMLISCFLVAPALAQKQACKTEQGQAGDSHTPKKQKKQKTCKQHSETQDDDEQGKCQKQSKQNEACCCEDPSGGGGGDKKDDSKKKEEKGGGSGGGGSPPQMPQMPQQQPEKKDDPAKKIQQANTQKKACEDKANGDFTSGTNNCVNNWPVTPGMVVETYRLQQENCKKDVVAKKQRDLDFCLSQYNAALGMPGGSGP